MTDLMRVWNKVDKTDPKYTKRVQSRGGFTAIDAMYQAKKATEVFGMYGKGWGLSETKFDTSLLELTGMVIHEAVFFYVQDDKRYEFPIHNAIKPMLGAKADEDWPKKVETNTISKALSRLGFGADVFMGDFDDTDYVQERINQEAMEKAEDKDAEALKQAREYDQWFDGHLALMESAVSLNELRSLYKLMVKKCKSKNDDKAIIKIDKMSKARAAILEEKEKEKDEA